jgi:hypothetical protein
MVIRSASILRRHLIVYALFLGFEQLIIEIVLAGHAQRSFAARGMSQLANAC